MPKAIAARPAAARVDGWRVLDRLDQLRPEFGKVGSTVGERAEQPAERVLVAEVAQEIQHLVAERDAGRHHGREIDAEFQRLLRELARAVGVDDGLPERGQGASRHAGEFARAFVHLDVPSLPGMGSISRSGPHGCRLTRQRR
jgi:hypothetical protein